MVSITPVIIVKYGFSIPTFVVDTGSQFALLLLTPAANFHSCCWRRQQTPTVVVDAGSKFAAGVVDASSKHLPLLLTPAEIPTVVVDYRSKFAAGVVDVGSKFPPLMLTPTTNSRRCCWHRRQMPAVVADTGSKLQWFLNLRNWPMGGEYENHFYQILFVNLHAKSHNKVAKIIFYFARAVIHATVECDRLCYF
jgi:hypothetical protein